MNQSVQLSLRPWPEPDPFSTSLSSLIPRIQNERGPFRNVTKDGLTEELLAAEGTMSSPGEALHEKDDGKINPLALDTQQPNQRELVSLKRQELIKSIEQSQFEAMCALDLVALMISGIRPGHAETSMSRHLKDHIPSGSLGTERIRRKDESPAFKRMADLATRGWRVDALRASASSLLAATSRLSEEAEREATYWNEVLEVKSRGWAVCRAPRDIQSLSVRFGFSEAGADEKYRGLGILRRGPDGTIAIHEIGNAMFPRAALRIQILRNGERTGVSNPLVDYNGASGITGMPETARNYIYQNELFLEMAKEARAFANLGFRNADECITFRLGSDTSLAIDTVNPSEMSTNTPGPDDGFAQGVLMALHILLSHAHRKSLSRRRQRPAALTQKPAPNIPLQLLRPLVSHLSHWGAMNDFKASVESLTDYSVSAGLTPKLFISNGNHLSLIESATLEQIVDNMFNLPESKATIRLPGTWKVEVIVQTTLGPPLYGTRYNVKTSHDGTSATLMTPNVFNSAKDFEQYIQWCFERSLVNEIQQSGTGWTQVAMSNEMTRTTEEHQHKRLRIEVERKYISIRWTTGGYADERYLWDGQDLKMTLVDVLKSI